MHGPTAGGAVASICDSGNLCVSSGADVLATPADDERLSWVVLHGMPAEGAVASTRASWGADLVAAAAVVKRQVHRPAEDAAAPSMGGSGSLCGSSEADAVAASAAAQCQLSWDKPLVDRPAFPASAASTCACSCSFHK